MALFSIIVLFFLLLLLLLFIPVTACIDSVSNQYYIRIHGLVKASFEEDKAEIFRVRLEVFFFNFYVYPLRRKKRKKRHSENKKKVSKSKKRMHFKTALRLIKSFRIRRFYLDIDTGNCILNAKLYPVFALVKYNGANCNINFQGRNQLVVVLRNRPLDIIKSFINF